MKHPVSDFYEILGVSRDADDTQIKKAYRKKARQLHPDVAGPGHEEEFKDLSRAYETLSDPEKRQMYDLGGEDALRGGGAGFQGGDFGGFADMFQSFFGGAGGGRGPASRSRRGQDSLVAVQVDLAEVAFGVHRSVPVDTYVVCSSCGGSCCAAGTQPVTCSQCNGTGQVQRMARSFLGNVMTTAPCNQCQGFGTVIASPCRECSGEGRKHVREDVELDIPAGVSDGTRIRLSGRGEAGPAGGPRADLYVEIHEKSHPFLERQGDDLYTELRVPMTAAALGATFPLETLDGTQQVTVKAGAQGGDDVVLDGLGVGRLRRSGRGDLHVSIVVETPTKLDAKQKELLSQLAALRGEDTYAPAKDESVMGKLKDKLSGH